MTSKETSAYVLPSADVFDVVDAAAAGGGWKGHRLPTFLRWALAVSPGNGGLARALFCICSLNVSVVCAGMTMAQMLKSVPLGQVFGGAMAVGQLAMGFTFPNLRDPYFRALVLENPPELAAKSKKVFVGVTLFNMLIFSPGLFFLLFLPLVDSDLAGGPDFRTMWISLFAVTYVTIPYQSLTQCMNQLTVQATSVWSEKTRRYFLRLREALLGVDGDTEAPAGTDLPVINSRAAVNAAIAAHQAEMERWSSTTNRLLATHNTVNICFPLTMSITCLVMLSSMPADTTGGERAAAIALTTLFCMFMTFFMVIGMYSVAKPSMAFETHKRELLNDIRIVDANVRRGWTQEQFHRWLDNHELSAARAFGVKMTGTLMRKAAGFVSTAIGVILYFLLREELRGVLG